MTLTRLLTITFLCILGNNIFSQDFIAGIRYGYGEGNYCKIDNAENVAFSKINQFGITMAYSPYYSKLSVESAFEFEKNDLANYLYIPLCFRITIGKIVRPFIECGGYYSFLIKDKSEDYIMKNDYGARVGGGLLFALGRKWRIEAGYFKKYGFAGALEKEIAIPVNSFTYEKSRISPFNIEFTLKYRF
jgi:hypothetical protein